MTSPGGRIVVTSVGACTAFGRSARQLAFGYRAGVTAAGLVTVDGVAVRAAPAAVELDADAPFTARLIALAAPALAEACHSSIAASSLHAHGSLAVVLAIPQIAKDAPLEARVDVQALLSELATASSVPIDVARSTCVAHDHTAFAMALSSAIDALGQERGERGFDRLVVGGVDSWLSPWRLARLAETNKVVTADGGSSRRGAMLPGEGAAFLVLERERSARDAGRQALAAVGPIDVRRIAKDEPHVPLLAATVAKVVGQHDAVWLVSEANGETFRANAWAEAIAEAESAQGPHRIATQLEHTAVAQEIGDVGAATGAVAGVLATLLLALGEKGNAAAVVLHASDLAAGFALERVEGKEVPPEAQPPEPSPVNARARVAFRVLEQAIRRFRAIEHRIRPARRVPILEGALELGACLAQIEDELSTASALDTVVRTKAAASSVIEAVAKATRGAGRRGRTLEHEATQLEQLAAEIAQLASELQDDLLREAALSAAEVPAADGAIELLASRGFPRSMPFQFRPVVRKPDAPASEPEDAAEEELDEQPRPDDAPAGAADAGELTEPPSAASTAAAGECIDSVGRLWITRSPRPDSDWSSSLRDADGRLLAQLDYLFALAEPFATRRPPLGLETVPIDVVSLLRGADSPFDPGKAFAKALALACATDPRLAYVAVAKARRAPASLHQAFVDALSLGTSPHVTGAVAELVTSDEPSAVLLALEVLRRRRAAPVGSVVFCLFHASAAIRAAAARALSGAAVPPAAIIALESRLASETAPEVTAALLESLLRLRAPGIEERIARAFAETVRLGVQVPAEVRAARLAYARMLAALGRPNEVTAVLSFARDLDEIECAGWFGRVTAVGPLLATMEGPGRDSEPIAKACARALTRITGLAREAGPRGPKLVDAGLTTIDEDHLELDERIWRTHWHVSGGAMGTGIKYRFGRPFQPADAMSEHVGHRVRVKDRVMTSLEIAVTAPAGVFAADENAWAGSQIAALDVTRSPRR